MSEEPALVDLPRGLAELPVLGVGASLSFGVEPDPVALADHPQGPAFIEYAGAVQVDWLRGPLEKLQQKGVPLLYHPSCLNLCGTVKNPEPWLAAVAAHLGAVGSAWLAQDVAMCFRAPSGGYSIQLGYFVPPLLTEGSLDEATRRVLEVKARVRAPLLLEPAPVTCQLGDMDVFSWLGELARRTDSGLLIDAGHVVSHQLARGAGLLDDLDALDLSRVVELHIAGGVIEGAGEEGRPLYLDAHDLPVLPETWQVARAILERAEHLKAVCVECEGAVASSVLSLLRLTRERVEHAAASPALREKARRELAGDVRRPAGSPAPHASREREHAPSSSGAAPRPQPDEAPVDARLVRQEAFHLRLLFDQDLRGRFLADRAQTARGEGLDDDDAAPFLALDAAGFERDATLRRDYLMSALCRAFPLTTAGLGAAPGGQKALSAFLASPAMLGDLGPRTAAFGEHLGRLLDLSVLDLGREVTLLLQTVLELERARSENAAAIRRLVEEQGAGAVPPPAAPSSADKKRGRVALPPFLIACELPLPTGVIQGALDHVTPDDAWTRIRSGILSLGRLRTAARALPMPVTVLARGVTRGVSTERAGAGGISPLVDVSHLTVELAGRRGKDLAAIDGRRTLRELPEELRRLCRPLVDAGLLTLIA